MRFHFNPVKFYFRIGLLAVIALAFPQFFRDYIGMAILLLVAYFLGEAAYKSYKKHFFRNAIVFDFHGVMAKGDLNLEDFTDMPGMRELVVALRRNYKVALMTNMNPELYRFYAGKFGVEELFDFTFYSGKYGVQKGASPDFFKIVMRELAVSPERMVFIDDREDYLVGARAAGIKTIHFKSPGQVVQELGKMGVRV